MNNKKFMPKTIVAIMMASVVAFVSVSAEPVAQPKKWSSFAAYKAETLDMIKFNKKITMRDIIEVDESASLFAMHYVIDKNGIIPKSDFVNHLINLYGDAGITKEIMAEHTNFPVATALATQAGGVYDGILAKLTNVQDLIDKSSSTSSDSSIMLVSIEGEAIFQSVIATLDGKKKMTEAEFINMLVGKYTTAAIDDAQLNKILKTTGLTLSQRAAKKYIGVSPQLQRIADLMNGGVPLTKISSFFGVEDLLADGTNEDVVLTKIQAQLEELQKEITTQVQDQNNK